MQAFTFHNPTKIIFGRGTIPQIGREIGPYGKRILLVYGRESIKENGVYGLVSESLLESGLEVVEFSGVKPNPVLSHLREGVTLAKREGVDAVLGVGGGSVIDEAKAIAAGARTDGDVWDFFTNKAEIVAALPVLSVLTLAATGSEMNPTGVITNEETLQKFEISAPPLYPKVSILDPATMSTVPTSYIAYSAVDVISHVIEAYFTGEDPWTPIQDRLVEGLVLSVMESVERILGSSGDEQARATLMWAATLALNGLPVAGVGGFSFPNHMIEHSLSAIYDIPHGAGLGIVIPGWMAWTSRDNPAKFAQFAERVFGVCEGSVEERAKEGIAALKAWFRDIGSPVSLSDAGIPEDDIDAIAGNATMLADKWGMEDYTENVIREILLLCNSSN